MKLVLGLAILGVAPQIIGQEVLHSFGSTPQRAKVTFNADSIERQDPPGATADAYAAEVHLKGHVVIRACCMRRGIEGSLPTSAVFLRGDEAVYRVDTGDIEFRGEVHVNFQDYPK
jgi:hypothetical protein